MRVLIVHNRYRQAGGEDAVYREECSLLAAHGVDVSTYEARNDEITEDMTTSLALRAVWNSDVYLDLRRLATRIRPDIVHFHNTLPLISPAGYYAASAEGAAVVQTLHNYRLACANAQLLRDGTPCEACVGSLAPWRAVVHGCYRDDRAASAVVVAMLGLHRVAGTWSRKVDRYIVLSNFARDLMARSGVPADRIVVKPNSVPDRGLEARGVDRQGGLFVGRLSAEKGIRVLLDAWRSPSWGLRIIGDGPLVGMVEQAAGPAIQWERELSPEQVAGAMSQAAVLLVPSLWYEGFPRVIAEAFCMGLPIIVSGHGALSEIVEDGVTGLHVKPGDAGDLAAKLAWAIRNTGALRRMGENARRVYLARFTPEKNVARLAEIYGEAIEARRSGRPPRGSFHPNDLPESRRDGVRGVIG